MPMTPRLVEHAKYISDGLKIAKLALASGRICNLPLDMFGLPTEVVSKAEAKALHSFEILISTSTTIEGTNQLQKQGTSANLDRSPTRGAKAVTGKSYKALRQIINSQCSDPELQYCEMQKVRANDGTIEFVSPASVEMFKTQGAPCLVWNTLEAPALHVGELNA